MATDAAKSQPVAAILRQLRARLECRTVTKRTWPARGERNRTRLTPHLAPNPQAADQHRLVQHVEAQRPAAKQRQRPHSAGYGAC